MDKHKSLKIPFALIMLFSMVIMALTGCRNTPPAIQTSTVDAGSQKPEVVLLTGVGVSPRSDQPQDFTDFFDKVASMGSVVMWAGDWIELGKSGGGPAVVAGLASAYAYMPLIEAQFFSQLTGQLLRPLDETNRRLYREAAVNIATTYRLKYLGLGIEVNSLYEKSPDDFEAFVRLFDEVYDAVKAASPSTRVFRSFSWRK